MDIGEGVVSVLQEFGIVGGLFVVIILAIIYIAIKYLPIAFNAHFVAIDKMQEKFGQNLDNISNKYIVSVDRLSKEIEDHSAKHLSKLNDMHVDIKLLNNKNNG